MKEHIIIIIIIIITLSHHIDYYCEQSWHRFLGLAWLSVFSASHNPLLCFTLYLGWGWGVVGKERAVLAEKLRRTCAESSVVSPLMTQSKDWTELNWTDAGWHWIFTLLCQKKLKLCNILPTLMSVLHVSSGYTCHAHLWKNWSCWWTKTHGSFRSKSSSMVESTCMYAAQSLSRGTEDIFSFLSVFLFSDYGV